MDKELLFKKRLREDTVEIPGVGTVRVRGLNRLESFEVGEIKDDIAARERKMIALGLIDPEMTEDEVLQWQEASEGMELEAVSTKIGELSGMVEDSGKEAYKSV